jgi:hypothetical protein
VLQASIGQKAPVTEGMLLSSDSLTCVILKRSKTYDLLAVRLLPSGTSTSIYQSDEWTKIIWPIY